ncbi:interleukin-13 receptor subunit alpha-1-like isoform X2 [Xiphias gladius]|uniref:interleukin-13 receptor subunit alpha-1-like isoform X2 n=1 Tax=Xiphias gladius TaxID=8245 RepID=UPI001A99E45B|nr:interleukin-13 receptor subunit alpha-1-like isoform X2 [Xiphias gladius]
MTAQKPEENMRSFTREIFAFLICTALVLVPYCDADRLPPPTELSYKWLDPCVVNVFWSWQRPSSLPENCEIKYDFRPANTPKEGEGSVRTEWKNLTVERCVTDEMAVTGTVSVYTVAYKFCDGWNDSTPVSTIINSSIPRAEVVKDFKCVLDTRGMNCSWIPVNRSLNLTLTYRPCGSSEERIKSLKVCDQPYSGEIRDGCYLNLGRDETDICIFVSTEIGGSIIRPLLEIPSSKPRIREDKQHLNLSWTPPEVGKDCEWIYEICYTECNKTKPCRNFTMNERNSPDQKTPRIFYNEDCEYKLRSRVSSTNSCPAIISNWSEVVSYGTNKPPDVTLAVVAIVIPIVLFVCVILSCYCFRKHSDIICPIIPDPSAIFKEMMMNGNKELKTTTGSLYTPVPEPIEPCKITLITENSVLQQNS